MPRSRPLRSPHPVPPADALLPELRTALAAADLRLELLGGDPGPFDARARVDALARELVARMREARWDAGAAPTVITSVLAASVPDAEAVLLRAARFGKA